MSQLFCFQFGFPANGLGKAVKYGPRVWDPATYLKDPDEVPDFWFQPGPLVAIAAIWEVNQWLEDLTFKMSKQIFLKKKLYPKYIKNSTAGKQ